MNERKEIIRIHLRNKKHSIEENQIVQTADKTEGLSGAEIENVINLAALTCIRKARTSSDHVDSVLNGVDLNEQVKIFLEEKKRQGQNNYTLRK
jgi:ATP-dependent Zn protease